MRTSREGLANCPLDAILPSSQARTASARVLKNLAAQSHLSMRTEAIYRFSYTAGYLRSSCHQVSILPVDWKFLLQRDIKKAMSISGQQDSAEAPKRKAAEWAASQ